MTYTNGESTGFTYQITLERKVGDNSFDNIVLHRGYLLEDWEANLPFMIARVAREWQLHHLRCDEVKVTWDFTHPGKPTNDPGFEYSSVGLEVSFSGEVMDTPDLEDDIEQQLFQDMVLGILRNEVVPMIDFTSKGQSMWVNPDASQPS